MRAHYIEKYNATLVRDSATHLTMCKSFNMNIKNIISLSVILYFLSSFVCSRCKRKQNDNKPIQGGNKQITSLFKAGTNLTKL